NKSQMTKGSRFMWLNWTKSQVNKYVTKPNYMIFEGEHYNYKPLIHKRGILHNRDSWVIVDDIFGKFTETNTEMQLSWLLGTKIKYSNIEMDERYIQIDKTYVKLNSIGEKYIFDIR